MNSTKKLQILLVVAAVLCAIGIVASLFGGDAAMPRRFQPPWWISALEWLAFIPMTAISTTRHNSGITTMDLDDSTQLQGDK